MVSNSNQLRCHRPWTHIHNSNRIHKNVLLHFLISVSPLSPHLPTLPSSTYMYCSAVREERDGIFPLSRLSERPLQINIIWALHPGRKYHVLSLTERLLFIAISRSWFKYRHNHISTIFALNLIHQSHKENTIFTAQRQRQIQMSVTIGK